MRAARKPNIASRTEEGEDGQDTGLMAARTQRLGGRTCGPWGRRNSRVIQKFQKTFLYKHTPLQDLVPPGSSNDPL